MIDMDSIDMDSFVSQAGFELRNTRTVSQSTRQLWENLAGGRRTAFDRAMVFLGCPPNGKSGKPSPTTSEADRVAAARLMLLKLALDSDDPRWSSDVLDRLVKAVMGTPDGSVGDLYRALFGVLGDYTPELTKPVAGLIKDLVVKCFTCHRGSYESVDWRQFAENQLAEIVQGNPFTKAQLYLALQAIPPQFVLPALARVIAKGLENTAFQAEAASALAV